MEDQYCYVEARAHLCRKCEAKEQAFGLVWFFHGYRLLSMWFIRRVGSYAAMNHSPPIPSHPSSLPLHNITSKSSPFNSFSLSQVMEYDFAAIFWKALGVITLQISQFALIKMARGREKAQKCTSPQKYSCSCSSIR